jgi:hypothetical protein
MNNVRNKRFLLAVFAFFGLAGLFSGTLLAQSERALAPKRIEKVFYSDYYISVERGMYDGSRNHALYTYIISNLATPGFDPVRLLPAEDQALLKATLPDGKYNRDVIAEFVITRMAENNKKTTALMTVWKNKKDSLSRIVTLGK